MVDRYNFEIAALEALREKLRSGEIWVAGAKRYRNPSQVCWILGSSDLKLRQICFKQLAYSYGANLLKLGKVQFSFGSDRRWHSRLNRQWVGL